MKRAFRLALPHLLFFALAFWTIHFFWLYGVIPVDANDEANHTFIENSLFFRALANGHYLLINLFNAFGTPMLGEPVFVPWAPHSLTYAALDTWRGMMLNKVLTMFFSLEALRALGWRWGLRDPFASFAAIFTVISPAFVWMHNHHPHQGVLLYFSLVLLTSERFGEKPTRARLLTAALAYLALLVGVGINAVAIAHLFLAPYLFLSRRRFGIRQRTALLLAFAAPFFGFLPHLLAFSLWGPLTGRAQIPLFDFANVGHLDVVGLGRAIFYLVDQIHLHMDYALVQTIALPLLAVFAICRLPRGTSGDFAKTFLWLGLAPTAAIGILLSHDRWLAHIPFFKSSDPTRFLWISLLFFNAGAFLSLQENWSERRHRKWIFALLTLVALVFTFVTFDVVVEGVASGLAFATLNRQIAFASGLALMTIALHALRPLPVNRAWLVLAMLLLPKLLMFDVVATVARTRPDDHVVAPAGLEKGMEPFSRMASLFAYGESADQKLATHSIFGSNARSIVLSAELRDHFKKNAAIEEAYVSYYFVPFAVDRLDDFGIRYVLSRGFEVSSPHWRTLARGRHRRENYQLSERTERVTPVYCDGPLSGMRTYLDATYSGNEILVPLPRDCAKLVATFYRWPGWQVIVKGEPRELDSNSVFLTATRLSGGDVVKFIFAPWPARFWWAFALAGATCFALALYFLPKVEGLGGRPSGQH